MREGPTRQIGIAYSAIADPRQRRVTVGGVPSVSLVCRERGESGGHRGVADAGGDQSDALVGLPRTPTVPAGCRGASEEGGLTRREGRRRTGGGRVTHFGSRGARVDGGLRAPALAAGAERARTWARIWSITDA